MVVIVAAAWPVSFATLTRQGALEIAEGRAGAVAFGDGVFDAEDQLVAEHRLQLAAERGRIGHELVGHVAERADLAQLEFDARELGLRGGRRGALVDPVVADAALARAVGARGFVDDVVGDGVAA